jgi:Domain of unknown function (DUF5916)/Carbohydrate family 9 binding domain-like
VSRGRALLCGALALGGVPSARAAEAWRLPRVSAAVTLDGDLSEPAWKNALVVDTFYEIAFGDNRAPNVRTVARLMYDDRHLYLAVECDDPDPRKIRAPYVDRDNVFGDQDNFAVFIDPHNDRRTAQEFRVNPRGIQGDAIYYDANGTEDFAPDFYYAAAARITERGWTAELRIPFSSLRYPKTDPQTWGLLLSRNYPRDYRYLIYSSPLPRNYNCLLCHSGELAGLAGLPSSQHLVVAPYASGQRIDEAPDPGARLEQGPTGGEVGIDLKWAPGTGTALDATLNPDFSQVEADVAQIAVNNRFALFYPEKRPFFLEGVDLFDTPVQAVYTRTITSPRWGGRATGRVAGTSYTLLAADDRGGGSVVLPGPTSSSLAPQDYRSLVGIGRLRRELGSSFVGALYTGREIDGGGYNRVIGPDFQWRPGRVDVLAGQLLWSQTETPNRPDLAPEWDGSKLSGHALYAYWAHTPAKWDTFVRYRDIDDGFRADEGFVPQVGYRRSDAQARLTFFPSQGFLTQLRPYAFGLYETDRANELIDRRYGGGLEFVGKRNFQGVFGVTSARVLTGDQLLDRTFVPFSLRLDPSRWLTQVGLSGEVGQDIDIVNVRVGRGGNLQANVVLRPSPHLALDLLSAWSWLDVARPEGGDGRLFTAQVERVKLVYNFSARLYVRLIAEYVQERRDPALYEVPVSAESATFSGSALLAYRLNWQTALFAGYGDDREEVVPGRLVPKSRQLFVKVSYAFQR